MLNVERALTNNNESSPRSLSIGVNAKLSIEYTFVRLDGTEVILIEGTAIHVDEERGIGSHENDYFELVPGDYIVSYLN